jgi:hypothetical protein
MSSTLYVNSTSARQDFSRFLHSVIDSQVVTVQTSGHVVALVDANVLREHLSSVVTANAQVYEEDGAIAIVLPGRPFAVETSSLAESLDEMVDVLREYTSDWQDRLRSAPNHSGNWALVQLVELSSDEELIQWLTAAPAGALLTKKSSDWRLNTRHRTGSTTRSSARRSSGPWSRTPKANRSPTTRRTSCRSTLGRSFEPRSPTRSTGPLKV